jgi:mRNA-degrading endonuclease toxin of MazEF toxin-antitoxin module
MLWATVDGQARPWLIVQAEILNEAAPTLLAVPVTLTPQEAGWPLTVRLDADDTGFPQASWARVTLLRALRREQLEEPIATLRPARLDDITRALAAVLGMDSATARSGRNHTDRERAPGALSVGEEREHVLHS